MANTNEHKDQAPGQNKETKIYVNTIEHLWPKKEISFEELVGLAFPDSIKKEFDITYARGQSDKEGELLDGKSVPVHPGMEFLVSPTNES
ncbi:MAG: multiubiquitin domain-containing protein [Minisyncoccia bacterium]